MTDKQNLLLLLQNPTEPCFMAKGDKKAVFDVPVDYLPDRYKPLSVQLFNRFGVEANERIPVKKISLPSLGKVLTLERRANFNLFLPHHREIASHLIDIFMGMRNAEELLSMAVFARDHVNPHLFNYCLSVALLHRPDTQDLDVPSFLQSFPDKFLDSKVIARAREEANIVPPGSRMPIEIPVDYTASNLDEEHRLAYFREDIGLNLHHLHWRLIYPSRAAREIVNKNRRGELFYYMHQQIIARYNLERLCNQLKRVARFNDWRSPIREAYFPKLDSMVASRSYPARVANQTIKDLNREQDRIKIDVATLERWRDRILTAIHSGAARDEQGNDIPLTEFEGIDILGNMVEASVLSPNYGFYGDMHNFGHLFIAYIHDPDHRHLETFGAMGDSPTAMRDPMFYRWHAFLDDIFQQFKATLPRYTVNQLNYDGVTVTSCSVQSQGAPVNEFHTFWQQTDVDLSRGIDFQSGPGGSIYVRFTHLNHQPFVYTINVNNTGGARQGTCRIFMAPQFDERGNPWLFQDQRILFIELDRFVVNLKQGQNTITRRSDQSSVTIPFERTYRDLNARPSGGDALEQFNYCGCGWPHNLLIAKGTTEGTPCQLFVMVSNYENDKVDQDTNVPCNDASSYCGIKDKLYPDRRSMGYPFDRSPRTGVTTLQQFLTPNMRVQNVVIRFSNRTVRRQ